MMYGKLLGKDRKNCITTNLSKIPLLQKVVYPTIRSNI